ncbi:MAG: hypothetical protein L0G87_09645 [Renibacterium salmoninarum]|nr:hypothetical protein [Renibacterium salmoninarum]
MIQTRLKRALDLVARALPAVFFAVLTAMAVAILCAAAYIVGSIITAGIRILEILTRA